MEFVENRKVEKEQIKAIFQDMLKYSPSKLCGMLGNAIIVPVYTSLLTPEKYGLYRQNYCGCVYSKAEREKFLTQNR